MKTDIAQTHVSAVPGVPARVEIDVTNTAEVIDGITAIVDGINPDWIRLDRPLISLFPGSSERMAVIFDIPKSCPAGDYLVVVRVVSTLDPERDSVHDFWLTVAAVPGLKVALRPQIVTGGGRGTIDTTITNTGNAPAEFSISALEPTREVDCRVEPNRIVLAAGAEALLPIHLRGPRPWFGNRVQRQIHIAVRSGDLTVEKIGTFNQRPRIARGIITIAILAGIVALWALIFAWAIREMRAGTPPAKATGTYLSTGPDNIYLSAIAGQASGTVTAATDGKPLARITVEAVRIKSDGTPDVAGSAATGDDGTYTLPSLIPGDYKFRFTADGFGEAWYVVPGGDGDPAVGDLVRIEPVEPVSGIDVALGGVLGSLSGKIDLPPGSAGVALQVKAVLLSDDCSPDKPECVFEQTSTDGTIRLDGLPTPATYQVTVTGENFDTVSFQATVGGGQATVVNSVDMHAATGTIDGVVSDPSGNPLGGVEVIARSGNTSVRAVTPTTGAVGTYRIIGLPTPETYVVTFTLDGYSSQTKALSLRAGDAQRLDAILVGGSGTVTGSVAGPAGQPLGGVTVAVEGAGFRATSATLTTSGAAGEAGGFTVSGIEVPGDYTVTFSLAGYQSETVAAAFTVAGTVDVGRITLLPEAGGVSGTVTSGGSGLGEVTVTLTDGVRSQVTTSATSPAGSFSFADVDAGTYALVFERSGYTRRVLLITVAPGGTATPRVALAPASQATTTTTTQPAAAQPSESTPTSAPPTSESPNSAPPTSAPSDSVPPETGAG